jgi:hypothetical protein
MRALTFGALATAVFAAAAPAQQSTDSVRQVPPAPAPAPMDGRLRTEIALVRGLFGSLHVPKPDSFRMGNQEIAAGATEQGTVAVARGNLAVRGRVTGDAIVLHGDVVVYPGGSVGGNAIAVDGRVRTVGGVVDGDVRSIRGITGSILAHTGGRGPSGQPPTTWESIKMVLGWFTVLFVIGVGVLVFAEKNLDGVVNALEKQFARSFWIGVLAQLAAIPALLLIVVGLAVTLIGILLIPFAAVAYVIGLAGLLTLGFLAVSRFTGRAFFRGKSSSRAVSLRSLFLGLVIYVGLWMLAATFAWSPVVGSVLRAMALAGSWVALTFGLGATILTRAGTRREGDRIRPRQVDDLSWQTPTPVTGVVAARRPVVTAKES